MRGSGRCRSAADTANGRKKTASSLRSSCGILEHRDSGEMDGWMDGWSGEWMKRWANEVWSGEGWDELRTGIGGWMDG